MSYRKVLDDFYCEYEGWLKDGAPIDNHHYFTRAEGLCTNLYRYAGYASRQANRTMINDFMMAGLNRVYPFNLPTDGLCYDYHEESRNGVAYLNPLRRAWVSKWAALSRNYHPDFKLLHDDGEHNFFI